MKPLQRLSLNRCVRSCSPTPSSRTTQSKSPDAKHKQGRAVNDDTRKAIKFMALKAAVFILLPACAALIAVLVLL
ncbi:phosphoribosylformylglycinamidine synthase-associated small membrane protein [Roseibium denhamense]|uniref:phosphoribosylformylglycinamidine synthase-associated small membrane protein n=1 Tax=Roseibium denhamense TaxID=76305 RepID=UPI00244DE3CE|nr:phosphoribosylformylglycinamidine synthase-associated small membrane protein [Roseibium denhamense]